MFKSLFPAQLNNDYRGSKVAIWILFPLVISKMFMGFNCAGFNPWISNRWVLEHADSIPVGSMDPAAAGTLVFQFAAWGLALLVLSSLGLLALIRYRAMIPLMYLALGVEQIGRKALSFAFPVHRELATAGFSTGSAINWLFSGLLLVGFILSLWKTRPGKPEGSR